MSPEEFALIVARDAEIGEFGASWLMAADRRALIAHVRELEKRLAALNEELLEVCGGAAVPQSRMDTLDARCRLLETALRGLLTDLDEKRDISDSVGIAIDVLGEAAP